MESTNDSNSTSTHFGNESNTTHTKNIKNRNIPISKLLRQRHSNLSWEWFSMILFIIIMLYLHTPTSLLSCGSWARPPKQTPASSGSLPPSGDLLYPAAVVSKNDRQMPTPGPSRLPRVSEEVFKSQTWKVSCCGNYRQSNPAFENNPFSTFQRYKSSSIIYTGASLDDAYMSPSGM